MGDKTAPAKVEAPEKLGFWGKTKLAVKEFFYGAVEAAPKALLLSGLAFAGSAVMGNTLGFNPLQVDGFNKEVLLRLVGAVTLGSTISGAVKGVSAFIHADDPPKQTNLPAGRVAAAGGDKEPDVAVDVQAALPRMPRMNERARA